MSIISDARDLVLASSPPDPQRALELEAVKVSLRNLRSFPWVAEREQAGMLKLHGAYFAISDGVLHVLDEEAGVFSPA
jgi:carbonic anhydrase